MKKKKKWKHHDQYRLQKLAPSTMLIYHLQKFLHLLFSISDIVWL